MTNDPNDEAAVRDIAGGSSGARPAGTRWRSGRRLAAVATGTTIALGAGGIAYAATTDPTPAPSTSSTSPDGSTPSPTTPPSDAPESVTPQPGEHPADDFGHHGGGMLFGLGGMPLHGEQVVETEEGVYETVATQRGTVDAVSADEVTVTSEDGYSRTYVLTDESVTIDGPDGETTTELAVGDEVMLVASVESGTATVTHVVDLSELPALGDLPFRGEGGPGWGPGRHRDLPEGGLTESPDSESPDTEGSAA